jgi:hypothetical protein
MKRMMVAVLMTVGFCLAGSVAHAGWGTCAGCHNGTVAPGKDQFLVKFKTVDALVRAAQATTNPMMAKMKQDTEGLKAAAVELGLKTE